MEQLNEVDLQSLFQFMRFLVMSKILKFSYSPSLLIRSVKYPLRKGGIIGIREVYSFTPVLEGHKTTSQFGYDAY